MLYITFKSSLGKLNAMYHHSRNANAPVVVVVDSLSLDPVTNVNMFEESTRVITDTFIENGFSTLRFSFRQDNADDKKDTDKDTNNLLDLTAALDWLHTKNIESKSFWICGIDTGQGLFCI